MRKKLKRGFAIVLLVLVMPFTMGASKEVQQVETNGTIGFTGIYEPIGTPDPPPPESGDQPPVTEIAKPDGTLPQTNELEHAWLLWLGTLIVCIVFILWKQKKQKNKLKKLRK